jgi:hypothetical protein
MASCNESKLSDSCTCNSKYGQGINSKIFDFATQEYICCGNVDYNLADSIANNGGNLKAGAAATDDPRCMGWWTGSIDPSLQSAASTAGPSQSKLSAIQHQANISAAFPQVTIDGKTGMYDCTGKVSSLSNTLHTVPRFVSYKNPNTGGYIESVECVPHDDAASNPYAFMTNNPINTSEEFAIFKIGGCTDLKSETCTPINGIDTAPVGALEFSSSIYNGSKFPNHNNCDNNNWFNWSWILIFVLILVLVIILLWFFYWLLIGRKKSKPQQQYYYVEQPVQTQVGQVQRQVPVQQQTYQVVTEEVPTPVQVQTYQVAQPVQQVQVPVQTYRVAQPQPVQTYRVAQPQPVQTYEVVQQTPVQITERLPTYRVARPQPVQSYQVVQSPPVQVAPLERIPTYQVSPPVTQTTQYTVSPPTVKKEVSFSSPVVTEYVAPKASPFSTLKSSALTTTTPAPIAYPGNYYEVSDSAISSALGETS